MTVAKVTSFKGGSLVPRELLCSRALVRSFSGQKKNKQPNDYILNHLCRFTSGSRFYILIPRANTPNGSAVGIETYVSELLFSTRKSCEW